ncbi:MAG TPA: hypothetical protein VKV39_07435 [Candidatus Sulfotelmatobacter sp.]|nr:hypothetical protein [Candidatus Sulfotelmatobacter sp.]
MSGEAKHVRKHGDFERRDIGIGGVLYFLAFLAALCLVTAFIVNGLYRFLENRMESQQAPVSPLVTNAPQDTRKLPPEYKTDAQGADYQKYLEKNFPAPQLETNERTELNKIRLHEEESLATYGWVDQNAGTVHIPIERAMDLIAQRGLPVRAQNATSEASSSKKPEAPKGKK